MEGAVGAERAVDLVGGDMMEAERLAPRGGQAVEIAPCRLQQGESPDDVCIDEGRRAVDRAVHMGFRCEMEHRIGLMGGQYPVERGGVADVRLFEAIARMPDERRNRLRRGRISELVEVDDLRLGLGDQEAAQRRPDEARPTGDQDFHSPSHAQKTRQLPQGLSPGRPKDNGIDPIAVTIGTDTDHCETWRKG